jgi:hypothetical protein
MSAEDQKQVQKIAKKSLKWIKNKEYARLF